MTNDDDNRGGTGDSREHIYQKMIMAYGAPPDPETPSRPFYPHLPDPHFHPAKPSDDWFLMQTESLRKAIENQEQMEQEGDVEPEKMTIAVRMDGDKLKVLVSIDGAFIAEFESENAKNASFTFEL